MSVIVIIKRFKKYIRVKKTFNERIAGVKTAIYKEYIDFRNNASNIIMLC